MNVARFALALVAPALVATLSGCAAAPDLSHPTSGVTTVGVGDGFGPTAIEVPAGTTVTWLWQDGRLHEVDGPGFKSPLQTLGRFSFTFDTPGDYLYVCPVHPGMEGRVVVTGS